MSNNDFMGLFTEEANKEEEILLNSQLNMDGMSLSSNDMSDSVSNTD